MDPADRIQAALQDVVDSRSGGYCPPGLAAAIRHAVFPGGHRIRPRICLAVAAACGDDAPEVSAAGAAAIELLHCASLVHDDMPCFDNAALRRGRQSVHAAFGEPLALLCGDALIVLAFQALAASAPAAPGRLGTLIRIVGDSVGLPSGIVAGQAWESEATVPLEVYQRSKTGALFAAATMTGAAAAGVDAKDWALVGHRLGEAYQVADDLLDRYGDADAIGKPVGRDALLKRPNAAARLGGKVAAERLQGLVAAAVDAVPACRGQAALKALIAAEAGAFMQQALTRQAAA